MIFRRKSGYMIFDLRFQKAEDQLNVFRLSFFICAFAINGLFSQQTYFQQEVNYKIDVELNDTEHSLKGFEQIQYINNSNTSLQFIYFHLWPNAYKNNSTAFAKQKVLHKDATFHYAKEEDRGYIDSLRFTVNGKPVKLEYDPENIDVCKIILNEPLRSLDTVKIATPFYVKIPSAKFSRLGHDRQAYYISQWYPKPAVYDREGWHPMPYLDQGEFYSEFGSFDVSITLPKNYVLAATGDRIDADEEEDFLNNKVIKTLNAIDRGEQYLDEYGWKFPPSSPIKKTVRFKQFRVHDFAWFADKRFNVLHDQIELPNTKRVIDTWVFFTNQQFKLWKDALDYVNESTLFYSYLNGDYPYNNVSAVEGMIMAGGGMEYPNITVIGNVQNALQLDVTIAHEVGHNWFYGILGSNEREYPALDEGVNSFYEMRYIKGKYPNVKLGELLGIDSTRKFLGINRQEYWREKELAYFLSAKSNLDQPINTPAAQLSSFNYGSIIYSKTAIALDYLMDYMGQENFDKAMQFYFENYKFKHPQPSDLLNTLQYFSGNDLSWFNKYLYSGTEKIDYKIKNVYREKDGSYKIKVKNVTGAAVPFNLTAYKKNKVVGIAWYNGSDTTRRVDFPPSDVDAFKIDGQDIMPDINRRNNFSRTRGIFRKAKPFEFDFISKIPDAGKNQINYLPIGGYNLYNGLMLGAAIHNNSIFEKKIDFTLSPMFAFKSKTLTGFSELNFNFFPERFFRKVSFGINAKTFSNDVVELKNLSPSYDKTFFLNYRKITPHIELELQQKDKTSHVQQKFTYNYNMLNTQYVNFVIGAFESGFYKFNKGTVIHELKYQLSDSRLFNAYSLKANLQYDGYMTKSSITFDQRINVASKKHLDIRVFAGAFLHGNEEQKAPYRFRMSGFNGYQDYLFEYNYLGRSANTGLAFSQFTDVDGAFKVWTPVGQSTDYLITLNLRSPRIWKTPISVFMDIGNAGKNALNKEKILWASGIDFTIVHDIIDVYLPLFYSNDIKEALTLNNIDFLNTVRFTFNIHKVKPKEFIRNNFL